MCYTYSLMNSYSLTNTYLPLNFRANLGIFCSTPGIPLVRNVPKKMAMYMLFTGFSITGKEAYEAGLVSKVVQNDKFGKLKFHLTE